MKTKDLRHKQNTRRKKQRERGREREQPTSNKNARNVIKLLKSNYS